MLNRIDVHVGVEELADISLGCDMCHWVLLTSSLLGVGLFLQQLGTISRPARTHCMVGLCGTGSMILVLMVLTGKDSVSPGSSSRGMTRSDIEHKLE